MIEIEGTAQDLLYVEDWSRLWLHIDKSNTNNVEFNAIAGKKVKITIEEVEE